MCELAVEESDWLMVNTFETMQTHFIHIMENLDFLRKQLQQVEFLEDKPFKIAHIGGLDTGASRTPTIPFDVISLNVITIDASIFNSIRFEIELALTKNFPKRKKFKTNFQGNFMLSNLTQLSISLPQN
jgi:hypothetical protein